MDDRNTKYPFSFNLNQELVRGETRFIQAYGEEPNVIRLIPNKRSKTIWQCLEKEFNLTSANCLHHEEGFEWGKRTKSTNSRLIKIREKLWVGEDSGIVRIFYASSVPSPEVQKLEKIITRTFILDKRQNSFSMLTAINAGGVEFRKYPLKKVKLDIGNYYNDDFQQTHSKILAFLKDPEKSGIVMLHGKPGTGKTYYLRYLANMVEKRFIYIPNNLFPNLISPDSLPSLSSIPGNILLLEDAEDILIHRTHQSGSHQAIAQLLNLSDGFIADAFKFKIICTFNCELNLIDSALLRKGRLVTRYEFKELSIEKVNKILGCEINKPMTLSDVLNYQDENNGIVNKISTLGFSNRVHLPSAI